MLDLKADKADVLHARHGLKSQDNEKLYEAMKAHGEAQEEQKRHLEALIFK
jgi:hypothetical protein